MRALKINDGPLVGGKIVFIPCRKCQGTRTVPVGFYETEKTVNGHTYKVLAECGHHREWRLSKIFKREYTDHGFMESGWNISMESFVGGATKENISRLKRYTELLDKEEVRRVLMYIHGPNRTQKTWAVSWLGKEITIRGMTAYFVSMNDLITVLWESIRDESKRDTLQRYSEADVLIVDEAFDKSKASIWSTGSQIGVLDNFIRGRLLRGRGTIFVSNIKIDSIDPVFGQSLVNLLKSECLKHETEILFPDNYFDNAGFIPERLF